MVVFAVDISRRMMEVPAEYGAVVFFGVLIVNSVMFVVYQRQRERTGD
jgi:hypothetical protein